KVIRNSVNMGPSYSRNTGWDNASGELVAFLDANDRWKQNKLAVQASFMTSNAQYALTGHLNNFQKVTESREITFVDLLHQNTVQTSSIMIQRDIPVRFDPAMKYCEDHNFLIEVAYNYKIYFLGMVLGFLERPQLSPGGLSNNILEMRKGQLRIYVSQYKKHRIGLIKLIFMCTRSMAAHLLKLCSRFRETTGASS
ncbi:MAG: glycosyltransferase, partial [Bdellovibrionales bacterium]|nr:glycosyltransferase [Bdellovibrionales bacterium]